jgi:uncharacterized protein (TIGR02594 family)
MNPELAKTLKMLGVSLALTGLFTLAMAGTRSARGEELVSRAGMPALSAAPWLDEARGWLGARSHQMGLPSTLWCADFVNFVLARRGLRGTGARTARSFAQWGERLDGPRVGAIAVMRRGRGGGHVGIVSGVDARGNPIIVSGNHGRRVAEAVYPRGRIHAYVWPSSNWAVSAARTGRR